MSSELGLDLEIVSNEIMQVWQLEKENEFNILMNLYQEDVNFC